MNKHPTEIDVMRHNVKKEKRGRPRNPAHILEENRLGIEIRSLMTSRHASGKQLAENIGISEAAVSKILNGKSLPRPDVFARIKEVLCQSEEEETRLSASYFSSYTSPVRTEMYASERGVVIQEIISGSIHMRHYNSSNYIAIDLFEGRVVRTGSLERLISELGKIGAKIHAVHTLPE